MPAGRSALDYLNGVAVSISRPNGPASCPRAASTHPPPWSSGLRAPRNLAGRVDDEAIAIVEIEQHEAHEAHVDVRSRSRSRADRQVVPPLEWRGLGRCPRFFPCGAIRTQRSAANSRIAALFPAASSGGAMPGCPRACRVLRRSHGARRPPGLGNCRYAPTSGRCSASTAERQLT